MSSAAVQRGSIGTFAYVVKDDKTVTVRMLKLGPAEGENVVVMEGLVPGESVVTVGGDKLREGTKVEIITPNGKGHRAIEKKQTPLPTKNTAVFNTKINYVNVDPR